MTNTIHDRGSCIVCANADTLKSETHRLHEMASEVNDEVRKLQELNRKLALNILSHSVLRPSQDVTRAEYEEALIRAEKYNVSVRELLEYMYHNRWPKESESEPGASHG